MQKDDKNSGGTKSTNVLLEALKKKKEMQQGGYGMGAKRSPNEKGKGGHKQGGAPSTSSSIGHRPTGR